MYGSPGYSDLEEVTSFVEVHEVLRDRRFIAGRGRPEGREFLGDTMVTIDGDRHLLRRRLYAPLMSEANLARLTAEIVDPLLAEALSTSRLPGAGRCIPLDLVPLARDLGMRVAAALVGFDDHSSAERTHRLAELLRPLAAGATVEWSPRDHDEVIAEGLEAKALFIEEFFAPAWERRHAARRAGEVGSVDLLSLMAASTDVLDGDADMPVRETILFLAAATGNPPGHAAFAIDDLLDWAAAQPGRQIPEDDGFLDAAINETLRLHITGTPVLVRECTERMELRSTGRRFEAGALLGLDMVAANRDPDAFGDDPDEFDPYRTERLAARTKHYGVAFGGGPHICLGRALVLGRESGLAIDGLQFALLSRLLRRGVHRDPERKPSWAPSGQRHHEAFPIHLTTDDCRSPGEC